MADWLTWTQFGLSLASVLVAIGLVSFSRRNLPTLFLAAWVLTWGFLGGWWNELNSAWLGLSSESMVLMHQVIWTIQGTFMIAFALVYPNISLTRARKFTLFALFTLLAILLIGLLLMPWSPEELAWFGVFLLLVPGAIALTILARRWFAARTPSYRMQVLWGMLPVFFWVLHDGLPWSLYWIVREGLQDFLGFIAGSGPYIASWIVVGNLAVLLALAIAAHAAFRLVRGQADGAQRVLALMSPFLVAITSLQMFWGLHLLLDHLAVALVVYGVLRFNMVDLDLRLRWTINKGTIAAVFIAVFFVVSELAKVFFEDIVGNVVVGILASGFVVLFLAPLQRVADSLAHRALPNVSDTEEYRDYRRFQIYRVALEGVLQDGILEPAESRSLENLRSQLGISATDHEVMEAEVRDAITPRGTP